ncbi:Outer membrane lipoprotein-sorting protein [Lutibacter oricola]|uniref:Outer membrane lipoprotein-sorting protein n=1 Tax=Lutibacter oricola TaxID=762486 RepID=A0A1H3ANX7_9FLAO|nr:outer membrane lipoprotein carrier protein LolA [Lutibacter oricola]SDX31450.1 Outer membrane lipoprotein-sorting protein [Lutibacter oricola]
MKKLFLLVAIISVTVVGYSQNGTEAKALLDEVAQKVEGYNNMYIEFNHKLDNNDADVHQETKGNVTLKGDFYHLNYMGTEQIFDGKKLYLIIHEDEEVIIQNPGDNEEETLTPSKMFSFYKNGYTYKMGDLKNIKGVKIQYVQLMPIDSNSEITSVLVGIDVKTKHIYNIIEKGTNNTITTLTVNSFRVNENISDQIFTFDKAKYATQKKYTISETN